MNYRWKPWIANRQNAFALMTAAADILDVHGREEQAKELRRRCISEARDPDEMRAIVKEYVSVCCSVNYKCDMYRVGRAEEV